MASRPTQDAAPLDPVAYDQLRARVLRTVAEATPEGATVAVVSKGDPALVELEGRTGWHFPRDADGGYAGFHPRTSDDAVGYVEELRGAGARFLCLPATAFWWLDHYQGLAAWLASHCQEVVSDPGTCVLYDLALPPGALPAAVQAEHSPAGAARTLLDSLLPDRALVLVAGPSADGLAAPGRDLQALGSDHSTSVRRLSALQTDRDAFVLLPPLAPGDAPPAALEAFLERRAERVAQRERLGALYKLRPTFGGAFRSRVKSSSPDQHRLTDALASPRATELAKRLGRLGLPTQEEDR